MYNLYHHILPFLEGKLSEEERKTFEVAMRNDRNLADEVDLAREVIQAVDEPDVAALRSQLDRIMLEEAPGKTLQPKGSLKYILFVAGLALLGLLAYWLSRDSNTPLPANEYIPIARYESHFQLPDQLMTEPAKREEMDPVEQEVNRLTRQVNALFAAGNYQSALDSLYALPLADPSAKFYSKSQQAVSTGILLLQLNRPAEALRTFEEAEAIRPLEKASWYKAAALLALDRKEEAIRQLNQVRGFYEEQAKSLLLELEE